MTNVSLFVDLFCFGVNFYGVPLFKGKEAIYQQNTTSLQIRSLFCFVYKFLIFVMTIVQMGTQCRHVLLL